ncbi:hypothetical protein B0H10DRAFT_2035849 [Mycena sp. CBHHK59/15]|nr:hypothetical protein B0H10DRAFT_2035849 [Mycena sp. CBHHK59/15]
MNNNNNIAGYYHRLLKAEFSVVSTAASSIVEGTIPPRREDAPDVTSKPIAAGRRPWRAAEFSRVTAPSAAPGYGATVAPVVPPALRDESTAIMSTRQPALPSRIPPTGCAPRAPHPKFYGPFEGCSREDVLVGSDDEGEEQVDPQAAVFGVSAVQVRAVVRGRVVEFTYPKVDQYEAPRPQYMDTLREGVLDVPRFDPFAGEDSEGSDCSSMPATPEMRSRPLFDLPSQKQSEIDEWKRQQAAARGASPVQHWVGQRYPKRDSTPSVLWLDCGEPLSREGGGWSTAEMQRHCDAVKRRLRASHRLSCGMPEPPTALVGLPQVVEATPVHPLLVWREVVLDLERQSEGL